MIPSIRRLLPSLLLLCLCTTILPSQELKNLDREEWMGVYMGANKIGYLHSVVRRDKFEGMDVYRSEDSVEMRMVAGPVKLVISLAGTMCADHRFMPVFESQTMSYTCNGPKDMIGDVAGELGEPGTVEARYGAKEIQLKTNRSGKEVIKKIPIPKGRNLASYCMYVLGGRKLAVGNDLVMDGLNLDSGDIETVRVQVLRREKLQLKGKTYDALVVVENGDRQAPSWVLDHGEKLKSSMSGLGFDMILETKEEALQGWNASLDMAVVPIDKPIPDAEEVSDLRIRLNGLYDDRLVLKDVWQSAVYSTDKHTVEYRILSPAGPGEDVDLPVRDREHVRWLADDPGIRAHDKAVGQLARKIIGSERDAFQAALRLHNWVGENMQYERSNGSLSAPQIMKTRKGDCKHHALLYTALARSVGIPTRLVSGLIYYEGSLQYHAWAESWVGEWIPFDPTNPSSSMTAARIKLLQGGIETLKADSLENIIGRLKAEVLDYWPKYLGESEQPSANMAPPGSLVIRHKGRSTTIYPPNTAMLVIPESGIAEWDPGDGVMETYTGAPGKLIVFFPRDSYYEYEPGTWHASRVTK